MRKYILNAVFFSQEVRRQSAESGLEALSE